MTSLNKEQTERLLDVIFSVILLGLSLTSVYFFINGNWFSIIPNAVIAIFLMFIIALGTVFGLIFGVLFTVLTIYSLNEAREEISK